MVLMKLIQMFYICGSHLQNSPEWPTARTFCSVNSTTHTWVCYTLGSVFHPGTYLFNPAVLQPMCTYFLVLGISSLVLTAVKVLMPPLSSNKLPTPAPMPCKKHILKIEDKRKTGRDGKKWFISLKPLVPGDFPAGPVIMPLPCKTRDMGSISSQGTKILHALE